MLSNCLVQAWIEHRRRKRAWIAAGRPKGHEPYKVRRASRHDPRWIDHHLLGRWRDCPHCGGGVQVESFKPEVPTSAPWWRAWTHLWFRGRWVAGDAHKD